MARPKICVVITAPSTDLAIESIGRVQSHEPDLIEVRLDHITHAEGLKLIREATNLPLIATNRRRDQGGCWKGSEIKRVEKVLDACDAGFDYVDLELTTASIEDVGEKARSLGAKIIISFHDFEATPGIDELNSIMREEMKHGADICKIVGTARDHGDCLTYLRFLLENPNSHIVSFGMGEAGVMSRIFSPIFGGDFTYASSDVGEESAPGQISLDGLIEIYRVLGV
jgi:3-dehydroquinate dehydratase type I